MAKTPRRKPIDITKLKEEEVHKMIKDHFSDYGKADLLLSISDDLNPISETHEKIVSVKYNIERNVATLFELMNQINNENTKSSYLATIQDLEKILFIINKTEKSIKTRIGLFKSYKEKTKNDEVLGCKFNEIESSKQPSNIATSEYLYQLDKVLKGVSAIIQLFKYFPMYKPKNLENYYDKNTLRKRIADRKRAHNKKLVSKGTF